MKNEITACEECGNGVICTCPVPRIPLAPDMYSNDLIKIDSFGTSRERKVVACQICKQPTPMLGTRLCNRCWELKTRIESDPELARKILMEVEARQS